jgi:hypothetical protein
MAQGCEPGMRKRKEKGMAGSIARPKRRKEESFKKKSLF